MMHILPLLIRGLVAVLSFSRAKILKVGNNQGSRELYTEINNSNRRKRTLSYYTHTQNMNAKVKLSSEFWLVQNVHKVPKFIKLNKKRCFIARKITLKSLLVPELRRGVGGCQKFHIVPKFTNVPSDMGRTGLKEPILP